MKTIFITLTAGQELRDFLHGGDFYELVGERPEVRVIFFMPPDKVELYRTKLLHKRCIMESMPAVNNSGRLKEIFRIMCLGCIPTKTIYSRNWFTYLGGGSFPGFLIKQLLWILGHTKIWRAMARGLEYYFFQDDKIWRHYFDKYRPDVVLGAAMIFEEDITMLKHAKRKRIPTVGMMRSWDNFTSKGFIRVHPDILLVQNSRMVEEAVKLNSFPRSRVRVVGYQQWDHYLDSTRHMSRREFGTKFGIDPNKRWITYFGGGLVAGLFGLPDRGDHILMLNEAIKRGEIKDAMVIVRVHPSYADGLRKEVMESNPILDFGKKWSFNADDLKCLANLVRHSDVALNVGSTMALESAIFNKPVVLIAFNGYEDDSKIPWHLRLSSALDGTLHYNQVEETGGIWRVQNEVELIHAVKIYLERPLLHQEGRQKILKEFVGPLGNASRRIFEILLSLTK